MKRALFLLVVGLFAFGCSTTPESQAPDGSVSPQQAIVDRSARAIAGMRADEDFRGIDAYLASARGVMIFPRVIKAAFLLGGEGGNGVLVARTPDGGWSQPAFYSIGAGSVGLQIGYQEATVVLLLMNDTTLLSVIDGGFTLGADASVAAGTVGKAGAATGRRASADVIQVMDVGGVFAGVSLDGAVLEERDSFNQRYYGPGATTHAILIERKLEAAGGDAIRRALEGT